MNLLRTNILDFNPPVKDFIIQTVKEKVFILEIQLIFITLFIPVWFNLNC